MYEGAFGWRDRANQLPVTVQTLFSTCSLTKSFSVLPFLIAQDQNLWDMDAVISENFSSVLFKDRELQENITALDLMSHRSGLPSNDLLWALTSLSRKEIVERFASFLKVDTFRKSFNYCNLGYTYLDMAFQNRFNSTLAQHIEKNVLGPLNMKDTFFLTNPKASGQNIALPYTGTQLIEWMNTESISAAGGIFTTIEDMSRWLHFHLNSTAYSKDKLNISAGTIRKIFEPQVSLTGQHPIFFQGFEWLKQNLGYSLGWFTAEWNSEKVLFHPGFGDGFSASILLLPESGLAVSVLTNSTLSSLPGQLTSFILESNYGRNVNQGLGPTQALALQDIPIAKSPVKTEHLKSGFFHNSIYGTVELKRQGTLWSLAINKHNLPLTFVDHDEAFVKLPAFGIQLPMSLKFIDASKLSVPLSMDPRVPPQIFTKK